MEDKAREDYIAYQNKEKPGLTITKCCLEVSMANPWLAASPDGVVHDPNSTLCEGLVECKAPYSLKEQTIEEAYLTKKSFCLKNNEEDGSVFYSLKKRHDYYFQIQCQIHCCDVSCCDFVVRTENDVHVERIMRNMEWCEEHLPKLKAFYFDALLPELASPRQGRGGIREPNND